MSILVAFVCLIVFTLVLGSIASRLHPACSSMDFPSNDAYFAHLKRRDRFFLEEHVGMAALNTVATFGILAYLDLGALLPAVAFAGTAFLSWCTLRLSIRRKTEQMFLWDGLDKTMLCVAIVCGAIAAVVAAGALGLPLQAVIYPAIYFVLAWLVLFPL